MIQAQTSVAHSSIDCGAIPVAGSVARFQGASGVEEYHLMIRPTRSESAAAQLEWLSQAYGRAIDSLGLSRDRCVFRRFFCSDLTNQAEVLEEFQFSRMHDPDDSCAISLVCQPPAPPAKVALWAYLVNDPASAPDKCADGSTFALNRGDLAHLWTTGVTCATADTPYGQTAGIFRDYEGHLSANAMRLADHVIRTWFFVRDVDANYHGLVEARRDIFAERGLTPDTHFIASTGIEGASADIAAAVTMDAYAISGVRPEQIEFLTAPEHLSPTYIYGVTFERGVSVAYHDRKHVLISGTASIDSEGRIVHPGDMTRQLDHTIGNVDALLRSAGAGLADVCSFIVYVRDPSDIDSAGRAMRERFGETPFQVVLAPVCRPGWLVEIECMAIVPVTNPALPAF